MLVYAAFDNTLSIYFRVLIRVEPLEAIQALGHDWEASAANLDHWAELGSA